MSDFTPHEYRWFVLDQLETLLAPRNGLNPTTETVRTFIVAVWACGHPNQVDPLRPMVSRISEVGWEFQGFHQLREIAEELNR